MVVVVVGRQGRWDMQPEGEGGGVCDLNAGWGVRQWPSAKWKQIGCHPPGGNLSPSIFSHEVYALVGHVHFTHCFLKTDTDHFQSKAASIYIICCYSMSASIYLLTNVWAKGVMVTKLIWRRRMAGVWRDYPAWVGVWWLLMVLCNVSTLLT